MAQNNLAFYGEGVLTTTTYPTPFALALTGFSGTVGKGIGYDPTGIQVRVDDTAGVFTVPAANISFSRLDLLVIRYKAVGDTIIPEPDLPTQNVYLNLHDGYEIAVIKGTASATPNYPAKGQYDIILAGIVTPANGTPSLDLSIREIATPLRAFFPTFKQEQLTGAIDGTNTVFAMSAAPYDSASLFVSVDGVALRGIDYSLSGQNVTLDDPPAPGQKVYAFYVVNSAGSVNPVSGVQEVPTGVIDGANQTFGLSQEPVDQNSTQVYIDGLVVPVVGWSLVQNPTTSQIVFNAGWIPQPGQDVYAFYLKNVVSSSGVPTSGGGSGGGGSGTGNFSVEYPQLSPDDISNGFVVLSHTAAQPAAVLLDIIGGGAQAYGTDFTVSGTHLTWSNTLAPILAAGDRLRVFYAY